MNLEEYDKIINDATEEVFATDGIKSIDIIAVLESAKMSIQIIMHEQALHRA